MESDKERVGELVGNRRSVVETWVGVAVASHYHPIATLRKFSATSAGEGQNNVFLFQAVCSTRSVVCSAMGGIDHDSHRRFGRYLGSRNNGGQSRRDGNLRRRCRCLRKAGAFQRRTNCHREHKKNGEAKKKRFPHGKQA